MTRLRLNGAKVIGKVVERLQIKDLHHGLPLQGGQFCFCLSGDPSLVGSQGNAALHRKLSLRQVSSLTSQTLDA